MFNIALECLIIKENSLFESNTIPFKVIAYLKDDLLAAGREITKEFYVKKRAQFLKKYHHFY